LIYGIFCVFLEYILVNAIVVEPDILFHIDIGDIDVESLPVFGIELREQFFKVTGFVDPIIVDKEYK
jgi:hypothetical protein